MDGDALLQALRGSGSRRPEADRGWSGGLREHLEDLVGPAVPVSGRPVRVGWQWLPPAATPGCRPTRVPDARSQSGRPRPAVAARRTAMLTGPVPLVDRLVAALFRQHVTGIPIGDPLTEAVQALAAEGDPGQVVVAVDGLAPSERAWLAATVASAAYRVAERWPPVDPRWLPVAGDLLLASLAGGRVVVGARPDLCLGPPASDRASRCLLVVTAGRPGCDTWRRLWTAALVETLRAGVPPFRLAALSVDPWGLAVQGVDTASLWAAADALGQAVLTRLRASQAEPVDQGGPPPSSLGDGGRSPRPVRSAVRAARVASAVSADADAGAGARRAPSAGVPAGRASVGSSRVPSPAVPDRVAS